MDWDFIRHELFIFSVKAVTVIIFFFVTKSLLKFERKDEMDKANFIDIIWDIIRIAVVSILVSYVASKGHEGINYSLMFVWLCLTFVPGMLGLLVYINSDKKMTIEDRRHYKFKEDKKLSESNIDDRF